MSDLTSGASTQDLIALAVSAIIFLITVVLVARQAVNFLITMILLFLTLVSGFAIANNKIIRQKFETPEMQKSVDDTLHTPTEQPANGTFESVKMRVIDLFKQLVELLSNQSASSTSPQQQAKVQQLLHDIETKINSLEALLESGSQESQT